MAQYKLKTPEFVEKTVVEAYKKVETAVVGTYKKIEDKFVDVFLEKVDGGADMQDSSEHRQTDLDGRS